LHILCKVEFWRNLVVGRPGRCDFPQLCREHMLGDARNGALARWRRESLCCQHAGRKPAFSIVYGRGTAAVFALGAAGSSVRSSMLLLHLDGLAALK
jgi:hypothetical protein